MLRFFLFQFLKQHIYCIFKCLIIFPCFRSVDKLKQGRKVLFFFRCFIPDIADQCTVQKPFCLRPEILTGLLPFPFGVYHDSIHQFQNIFFRMDIVERVIVHTLGKIDRIQYFHFISMPYQHLSALNDDRSLGVRDHITDIFSHLHQIWFYIKPGLSGTRSANYNHVLVPCKFRILGSAVHSQPFGHGKENIVLKYWVDKGCNVFCCPPSSRTILHSLPELFGIFPF